jgi:hypothetical protein
MSIPHGVERRREIWRFEPLGSAEKNFLAKITCNSLISLVSDERIQGNPRKSKEIQRSKPGVFVEKRPGAKKNQTGPLRWRLAIRSRAERIGSSAPSLRRCGVLPLRRAISIGNLVGVACYEIVVVVDLSRGLERLIHVGRALLVGQHAAQD